MSVQSELNELMRQANGLLQVETVVSWAERNPRSALYHSLEWDNVHAGHSWRCEQVRRLIAIHVVNVEGERQIISLSIDRSKPGGGYRNLDDVIAAPDLRDVLLGDALAELERVQARYQHVVELAQVWVAVGQARRRHKPAKEEGEAKQA